MAVIATRPSEASRNRGCKHIRDRASIRRAAELWSAEAIEDEPPRYGWLCNRIRLYPGTLQVKAAVHFRAGGLRPLGELEPIDHLFALEQRQGISMWRVQEIVATLMHLR